MGCPLSCFSPLGARQFKAPQASRHAFVSISQFFRRPELRILVLQAHHQITQPTEYRPSNALRAERLRYLLGRIVGLSQFGVR